MGGTCGSQGFNSSACSSLGFTDRFSRDRPRFTDTLDAIKFLCKDMWTLVFRKQIDNLKTNHRVLILFYHLCVSGLSVYGLLISGYAGCLRSYRQQFQTLLPHECGVVAGSSTPSATGRIPSVLEPETAGMLTHLAVPLVSMRCHTRGIGKHGHQRDGTSGDFGTPSCNISNQDRHCEILISIRYLYW